MGDLITVSVPTYRRPTLLLHCVHSCFIQDYRPLEIDISDNSPNDETGDLVRTLTPPPGVTLRYWRNTPALSFTGSVQKLYESARGRRLLHMNDDDALLPGAVTALDAAFSWAPDVVAAYGRLQRITPAGEDAPEDTEAHNLLANRTSEHAGVRRDLLVCALWRQIPPVSFLIDTETARKVGYDSDRAEVGLNVDTDFGIRLAKACRGKAFALIDRVTCQYRLPNSDGLTKNELDLFWKFYGTVERMEGLTQEEALARDWLLARLAHPAVVEHALGRRRVAALRVLLSRRYPHAESLARSAYALSLTAMPGVTLALRRAIEARWRVRRPSITAPLGGGGPEALRPH